MLLITNSRSQQSNCLKYSTNLQKMTGNVWQIGQILKNHSGFKPGDSCLNQLLSITPEIYKLIGDEYDVQNVFLDISKAFIRAWHEGIISKLKQSGIYDGIFNICDFLKTRKQRIALNGQVSM